MRLTTPRHLPGLFSIDSIIDGAYTISIQGAGEGPAYKPVSILIIMLSQFRIKIKGERLRPSGAGAFFFCINGMIENGLQKGVFLGWRFGAWVCVDRPGDRLPRQGLGLRALQGGELITDGGGLSRQGFALGEILLRRIDARLYQLPGAGEAGFERFKLPPQRGG